jgi:hypothetical protein
MIGVKTTYLDRASNNATLYAIEKDVLTLTDGRTMLYVVYACAGLCVVHAGSRPLYDVRNY